MQSADWKRVRVNQKGVPPTNARGDKQTKTIENASKVQIPLKP